MVDQNKQKPKHTMILGTELEGIYYKQSFLDRYQNIYNIVAIDQGKDQDIFEFSKNFANKVLEQNENLGIILTGDGVTSSIIFGKIKNIRACLCSTYYIASMTRLHNNSNILIIGAHLTGLQTSLQFVEDFMTNDLDFGEGKMQHYLRVNKMMDIQNKGVESLIKQN